MGSNLQDSAEQGTQSDDFSGQNDQSVSFSTQTKALLRLFRPNVRPQRRDMRRIDSGVRLRRVQSLGRDMGRSISGVFIKGNPAFPQIRTHLQGKIKGFGSPLRVKVSGLSPISAYSRKPYAYSSWREEKPVFRLRRRAFLEVNGVGL